MQKTNKEDTAEAVRRNEKAQKMQKKSKTKKLSSMSQMRVQQSQYINLFKEQGIDAVILKHNIDICFHHTSGASGMTPSNSSVSMQMSMQIMKEEVSEEDLKEENRNSDGCIPQSTEQ